MIKKKNKIKKRKFKKMNKYKQKNLRLFYQRLNLNTKLHKNKNKKWFHKMMINNHYRKKKITLIKMDKIVR